MKYSTLVSARTLGDHQADPDWIVFDVRHDLSDVSAGEAAYLAGHIPGARFLHLDRDLSTSPTGRNGRHPLPSPEAFAELLSLHGVGPSTQIVAYDAHGGMFASRLWWMARWIGHEAVAVLDGGLLAWIKHGGEIDSDLPAPCSAGGIKPRASLVEHVVVDQVLSNLQDRQKLVIDARSPDRFRGENETIDPVGGHIPGAVNRFFKDNLLADGRFKPAAQLRNELQAAGLDSGQAPVHQCGSGVTACHNLLAMEHAGLHGSVLYPGSWSEWCADPKRPVAVG